MRSSDALKYIVAKLDETTAWTLDQIGDCDNGHDVEVDALLDLVAEAKNLVAGDPRTYSDGRVVKSQREIQDGLMTSHVWHPDAASEKSNRWRGNLPSGHPDRKSPGVYQVSTNPMTQVIDVRVVRLVGEESA